MCGIAGIVDKKGINSEILYTLSKTIRHRGPDDEGYFCLHGNGSKFYRGDDSVPELQSLSHVKEAPKSELAFVHRRLSILDLSANGHQPMLSKNARHVLNYNGEIYNYIELRKELVNLGFDFVSDGDSEVILNAFAAWGQSAFEKFAGMWALAIYDNEEKELILSRDRFGIKPLYYSESNGKFVFASEIKCFWKVPGFHPHVSKADLFQYVSYGALSLPYTNLFKNIRELTPGTNLRMKLNTMQQKMETYFELDSIFENAIKSDQKLFENQIDLSVAQHMRSDVVVGSCLSGGLDSSTLVTSATGLHPGSFKTITASYDQKEIDESKYVHALASENSKLETHFIQPTADNFIEDISQLVYHQDLPFGSTSIYAQWAVMRKAKEIGVKVLLDGQGPDELLGGYYPFAGMYVIELLKKFKFLKSKAAYSDLRKNFTPKMNVAISRAAFYFLPRFIQTKLRKKHRLGMQFINPSWNSEINRLDVPNRGGRSFDELIGNSVKMGLYELLRYEDRNSMAFSIESRVPFLDHRFVDVAIRMPMEEKIVSGWTKMPIRKYLAGKAPEELIWRKDKLGFVTPQNEWRKTLNPFINEYLDQHLDKSLFNKDYILALKNEKNLSNVHLSEYWRLFSIIKWMEVFNVEFD